MRLLSILILLFCISIPSVFAEGYIGEDLGTDIYRRVDKGNFRLKKEMIDQRLKGSAEKINRMVGMACGEDFCFDSGYDFAASDFDKLGTGDISPIQLHLKPKYQKSITTDTMAQLTKMAKDFYSRLREEVDYSQKKLQSVGSIGLFTDGDIDNSSYDLMYDLEQIHRIIFSQELPYNGEANMGAESIANMLAGAYDKDKDNEDESPADNSNPSWNASSGVSQSGSLALSGLVESGSFVCPPSNLPTNLDTSAVRDLASQRALGISGHSSYSLMDNGYLPEYWARFWAGGGGIPSGGWSPYDSFKCSSKDIFCITLEFIMYSQNLFAGWPAYTIERILDENLKIANKYAGSSFVQSQMTNAFFQCDICKYLNLASMAHIGTVVTRLPPPILNLKGDAWDSWEEKTQKAELNEILVHSFESVGIKEYERQNSIVENDSEALMVGNMKHLTTDSTSAKAIKNDPAKDAYILAKEMELKKQYFDTFSDDLLALQAFTLAFSKNLSSVTSLIKWMYEIPQK